MITAMLILQQCPFAGCKDFFIHNNTSYVAFAANASTLNSAMGYVDEKIMKGQEIQPNSTQAMQVCPKESTSDDSILIFDMYLKKGPGIAWQRVAFYDEMNLHVKFQQFFKSGSTGTYTCRLGKDCDITLYKDD
jgi:hypothetical protein